MIVGKVWGEAGSSRNISSYKGYSVLSREEDGGTLVIVTDGGKV